MTDLRKTKRRRILKGGAISFRSGRATCAISNLSKTGARIEVTRPAGIPDAVVLVVQMESTKRLCEVMWRKQNTIGVRFQAATS